MRDTACPRLAFQQLHHSVLAVGPCAIERRLLEVVFDAHLDSMLDQDSRRTGVSMGRNLVQQGPPMAVAEVNEIRMFLQQRRNATVLKAICAAEKSQAMLSGVREQVIYGAAFSKQLTNRPVSALACEVNGVALELCQPCAVVHQGTNGIQVASIGGENHRRPLFGQAGSLDVGTILYEQVDDARLTAARGHVQRRQVFGVAHLNGPGLIGQDAADLRHITMERRWEDPV